MAILDIIALVILCYTCFKGYKSGLIKELAGLLGLIVGIFLAIKFSDFLASWLQQNNYSNSKYLPIISFIVIFVGTVILIFIMAKLLNKFVELIKLEWLNKLSGVVFSGLKFLIIAGGLFYIFGQFNQHERLISRAKYEQTYIFRISSSVYDCIFPYTQNLRQQN